MNKNSIDVKNLETITYNNYNATRNYYVAKKKQFLRLALDRDNKEKQNNIVELEKNITIFMEKIIIKEWEELTAKLEEKFEIKDFQGGSKYKILNNDFKELNLPEGWEERFKKGENSRNFYSEKGFLYEDFLDRIFQNLDDYIKDKINKGIGKLLEDFDLSSVNNGLLKEIKSTGTLTSKSSLRENGFIRADIGINLDNGKKEKGVLYGKTSGVNGDEWLPVEIIENNFNIKIEDEKKYNIEEDEILKKYLNSSMFGFSVKAWKNDGKEKEYTQASVLKNEINNKFNNGSWNVIEAMSLVNEIISEHLIELIGPVNIAIFTGYYFQWMDSFVGSKIFTMHVKDKNHGKKLDKDKVKPYIDDAGIYVRNYAITKGKTIISSAKMSTSDKEKDRYRILITLNRKKK